MKRHSQRVAHFSMNMKTIYIFGNILLDFDNTPIKLIPELQKEFPDINFVHQDPNENIHPENKKLFIIDTIEGIDEVKLLDDINKIELSPSCSMHDFDLGFNLKLLQKIGLLNSVLIFGVPMKPDKDTLGQLLNMIEKYV